MVEEQIKLSLSSYINHLFTQKVRSLSRQPLLHQKTEEGAFHKECNAIAEEGLEPGLTSFVHKGPETEHLRLCNDLHTVCETTIQFCPRGMKAAIANWM